MRAIQGTYTFYQHIIKKPERFSIELQKNTVLEIQSRGNLFDFYLMSDAQEDDKFLSWINLSAYALGFLLDFPIYPSFFKKFEENTYSYPNTSLHTKLSFDYIFRTLKYDEVKTCYIESEISKEVVLLTSEIRNLIIKLQNNKTLSEAVYFYLKSIEEPEFFLALLYNAYELIQNTGGISKTHVKKFKRLANDISIIGSRHTSKQATTLRQLSYDERDYCKNLIRNGVLHLANK